MKKILLLLAFVAVAFLCISQLKHSANDEEEREAFEGAETEEQDGIRLAQEQDFQNTVDVKLGYVPRSRLIAVTENMVAERRALRLDPALKTERTEALSWTERGPNADVTGPSNGNFRGPVATTATSGRMRAIWVDLADATNKTVWTGGIDGGIWKTTDVTASPATWTPVNDVAANLAISSICQDPSNTNVMYYGTGEKTYNLDAVLGGGIWKSTDHGVTWNLLPSTTNYSNISRIACDASGNVYAATIAGRSAGIFRSTDGGSTWTIITPTGLATNVTELKISSTGRLHIVCGYNGSSASGYRYTDNPSTVTTSTWTSPAVTFTPTAYNVEITTAGNNLYALPANASYQTPTVYKSTDGGANWAACSGALSTSGHAGLSSGQGWYCLAIAVDPANANNVIVGGLNTYKTTDGGASWTQVADWASSTLQYVHADQHFVTWNGNQVLIASDGGLFYSADGGTNWADRNRGLRLKQFYSCAIHPTTTDYIIGGAQDNGTHQLTSAGLAASVEVIGGDGAFTHIDQDQPQYQFSAFPYNAYIRSTNGGSTWGTVTYSSSLGKFINPWDYDDYNNLLYAADAAGKFVRWNNPQTGSSFTSLPVAAFAGSSVSHVKVSPYTGNRVYFGTDGGRIVSVDNVDQASPTSTNLTGSGMDATPVSCVAVGTTDNTLVATFSNYGSKHVWMSTTGGGAGGWTNITGNLPDIPVRWAMFYPYDDTKIILATEAGIYETTSVSGASTVWTQNTTFPIVRTDMLQYRSSDGTVAAATHGRGIWTASVPVAATYSQFATTQLDRPESTSGTVTSGCTGYTDYVIYLKTNRAPTGTATATVSVSGGTAVRGVDYDFTTNGSFASPSTTVTLANGSTTPQPITIRIYDNSNAEASPAKTFTLSYTLTGTTDVAAAPASQTFTFTIRNDDLAPSATATAGGTLGTYQYNLGSSTAANPFNAALQSNRCQMLYKASELTAAGITAGNITSLGFTMQKNSTRPFSNFSIKMGLTSLSYLVNGSTTVVSTTAYKTLSSYTTVNGLNTFVLDAPFAWDGTNNVVIEICYDNGSADAANFSDVLQGYSDGGTSTQGNMFWQNGINCSTNFSSVTYYTSGIKPTLAVAATIAGNTVETAASATKTSSLSGSYDVYFYNGAKIMARIQNASGFNYGCTQVSIDRAGTGAVAFWNNTAANYLASKTFRVVPTANNTSGQYQITLYYTAAEKAGWEAATGQNWNNIKLVKVKSQISNYTAATPAPDGANAVDIVTPTLGTFGSDYTVTGTFSSGFSGFGVGIPSNNPLPVILLNFSGRLDKATALLNWSTSTEQNAKNFDVEKSTDGTNFYRIGTLNAAGNSSTQKDYSFSDEKLSRMNYYRLRMNDLDGRNALSKVVLLQYNAPGQNVWVVNNPFTTYIDLRLAKDAGSLKLQLLNATGSLVEEKTFANAPGFVRWNLNKSLSNGTYILRSMADGAVFSNKLMKQ